MYADRSRRRRFGKQIPYRYANVADYDNSDSDFEVDEKADKNCSSDVEEVPAKKFRTIEECVAGSPDAGEVQRFTAMKELLLELLSKGYDKLERIGKSSGITACDAAKHSLSFLCLCFLASPISRQRQYTLWSRVKKDVAKALGIDIESIGEDPTESLKKIDIAPTLCMPSLTQAIAVSASKYLSQLECLMVLHHFPLQYRSKDEFKDCDDELKALTKFLKTKSEVWKKYAQLWSVEKEVSPPPHHHRHPISIAISTPIAIPITIVLCPYR